MTFTGKLVSRQKPRTRFNKFEPGLVTVQPRILNRWFSVVWVSKQVQVWKIYFPKKKQNLVFIQDNLKILLYLSLYLSIYLYIYLSIYLSAKNSCIFPLTHPGLTFKVPLKGRRPLNSPPGPNLFQSPGTNIFHEIKFWKL